MPISPSDRALGDLLVAREIITLPQLDEATRLAETWDVALTDAVLSRAWLPPEKLYEGLAFHYDLPFAELVNDPPDQSLLRAEDLDFYMQKLTMPWRRRDGKLVLATAVPGPETVLAARQRFGPQIEFAVASKFSVNWAVQVAFDQRLSRRAVFELADRDPTLSARTTFTVPQVLVLFGLLTAVAAGLAFAPLATLIALNVAMGLFYLGNFVFKGILVSLGGGRSVERDMSIEIAARALRDDELPVFTVLVPMFREARMLPRLADALRKLDYPLGKLDIKIVLEAEDEETIEVARNLGLEGVFEVIRVPPSHPQTKPKACNFALRFARGEYLVIYDAEDRPEPDQLRKVVETFRRSPPNTACLQCRLSYYNADENWLTRMFTLDYALWFDLVLPGLERLGIPIPPGRYIQPFQGRGAARAARLGSVQRHRGRRPRHSSVAENYRVGVVDSTTFEEASCRTGQWIRQRTRWIKGYMQTFLVHTRRPLHLLRTAGPLGFTGFVFFIGGTVLTGILNPIFWMFYLSWLIAIGAGFDPLFPQVLLFLSLFNLLAGNGAFIYLSMIAPIRRGWLYLIPFSLTALGYWVLISIAAYRAMWQLLARPSYWEKTEHGVSRHVDVVPARETP